MLAGKQHAMAPWPNKCVTGKPSAGALYTVFQSTASPRHGHEPPPEIRDSAARVVLCTSIVTQPPTRRPPHWMPLPSLGLTVFSYRSPERQCVTRAFSDGCARVVFRSMQDLITTMGMQLALDSGYIHTCTHLQTEEKAFPAELSNRSFFHSLLLQLHHQGKP